MVVYKNSKGQLVKLVGHTTEVIKFDKITYCPVCKKETLRDWVTGIYGDSRKSTHYCETCANYLVIEVINEK